MPDAPTAVVDPEAPDALLEALGRRVFPTVPEGAIVDGHRREG